jgi:hypothetical protein
MRRVSRTLALLGLLLVACGSTQTRELTAPSTPHPPPPSIPAVTLVPTATPEPTDTAMPLPPTSASTSTAVSPTSTSEPADAPVSPQVLSFEVTPAEVDPGETITLTWEARGDRATVCPNARYVLFSSDDCRQVPLSGTMTFTIPPQAAGFYYIYFVLEVETYASPAPELREVSVALKCDLTWFFSDAPQAGICPTAPLRSHAAAQRFERGTMIWLEQLGRYIVLEETLLHEGEVRRRVDYVHDPLEIIRDTSSEIEPPEGFYAPESGFGLVWRGDVRNSPGYRERLGWALAPEFGYEAVFQCDNAPPSGGRSWRFCHLQGPDGEVIVFHPLGGWYLLLEQ